MRFVALALILCSLPVFIALLTRYREKRDWALLALGVMMFLIGKLQIDAAVLSWPLWQGTSRGFLISPADMLAIALIVTRHGPRGRSPFLWLVLLYPIPATLSIFVSAMPMASFLTVTMMLRMVLFFVALAGELRRPSALRSLMTGIAIGLMIQGAWVAQEKLSGVVQARGTSDHQNILGMMVEMSLIPLVAMVLEGERRKIIYGGIIAGLVIVAGGGSRGTMGFIAGGLVLILVLSLIRRPTRRKGAVFALATLAAFVFVPLALGTLEDRFGSRSLTEQDEVRPAMEAGARAMAAEFPLGVGANAFVLVANDRGFYQRAGVPWGGTSLTAPVHNSFLLARAETGWSGQIVMVALLLLPMLAGLHMSFADRRSPILGMGLASTAVMMVTALHCNYEYAWHLEVVQRLFFTNLAILSACLAIHRAQRKASRGPNPASARRAAETAAA